MHPSQKQVIIGIVIIALLAYASGYTVARMNMASFQETLTRTVTENAELKKQAQSVKVEAEAREKELVELKEKMGSSQAIPSHVMASIRHNGVEPDALLADLRQNPTVIPEQPVLGGTMGFTDTAIINQRWVYGAYEDGHIAGAAVFQWQVKDSSIVWTPILVLGD